MVCHRSSTTSTRVSSPLVQTMKLPASTRPLGPRHSSSCSSNSGSMPTVARLRKQRQRGNSRLCMLACMATWLECPTGQGRLANQRASPSAHVGAVNDEGATRSEENRSSRFRVYSRPLRAFQQSFNDRYIASFELLDLTVHDMSDSLSRALIGTLLKESSEKDRIDCSSSQANCSLTEKELHQLRMDEETLRETLEEEAMNKKAQEEKIRQKQAKDNEFFLEFGIVRYDSEYESSD
ncbi:hypothetical protein Tco_0692130 [Tanacetum coccineum]